MSDTQSTLHGPLVTTVGVGTCLDSRRTASGTYAGLDGPVLGTCLGGAYFNHG